ncbi:MAG: Unknown protein [uncultured Thiotrichaceae bacterium]|uniref:Uncharacterized protein n=1 Tax=uncultured Thiotrichaceae bacterium TaxID=298394 RepID=A0A6S6T2C7_9GAMM|nr:MAG: Unknown protein [uncultured Thiotrichaceae bacterium]
MTDTPTKTAQRKSRSMLALMIFIQQIRRAIGEGQRCVTRLLLFTDNNAISEFKNILQNYQGMHIATGPDNTVQRITDLSKNPNEKVEGGVYLIDPLGNFMMS